MWELNRTIPAPERALHQFGGTIDGAQIEIKVYRIDGKYKLNQAYPARGEGVTGNTANGKVATGPNKAKRWKGTMTS